MTQRDPDGEIGFEQRKISEKRYESIPRRRSEIVLFNRLTPKQQTALERIELAYGFLVSGLPVARMRFHDAPGGRGDWELTPSQMQAVFDYKDWERDLRERKPACLYAVIRYCRGAALREIEHALRIRHGRASDLISEGLNLYCVFVGWGDQLRPYTPGRRVKAVGYTEEVNRFIAEYLDELGRPVAVFGEKKTEE